MENLCLRLQWGQQWWRLEHAVWDNDVGDAS
jgi:hypothetical protein